MSVVTDRLIPNERKTMNEIFEEMDEIVETFFTAIEKVSVK